MNKILVLILIFLTLIVPTHFSVGQVSLEQMQSLGLDLSQTGINMEQYSNILNTPIKPDIAEQISFSVSPTIPKPNQLVTAKVASYSTDLRRATISWYVNGVLEKQEIGATTHQFQTGDIGQSNSVRVVIKKINGETLEESRTFTTASVDLIYEAETYTPPFYSGKAYYTYQSQAKIVAIPQLVNQSGNIIDPNNIVYKWYIDGEYQNEFSGVGRSSMSYKGNIIARNVSIGVQVSDLDNQILSESSILLIPISPQVFVYEKSPLYGTLFNRIVSGLYLLSTPEVEFEAVPYFFDSYEVAYGNTKYEWQVNNSSNNTQNSKNIVLRNEQNQAGEANIDLRVSNNALLQQAETDFDLLFTPATTDFSF